METTNRKQNSHARVTGEIVKVAHGKEAAVAIPIIVHPVEVEVPLRAIPVQIRDMPFAIDERLGAFVCTIFHTTTHRALFGLNLICDLMYLFAQ